uniref:NADH-ubiquinone oxidoreductase chain 6 n=1 Tax=Ceuthophilus sp. TaxID=3073481 RepID=A0AAU7BAE4_9ORTH
MTQQIMAISLLLNFIFMQMNHPLSMLIIIIIQTLLICLITGTIASSFWFSYILFLIFLGGMLVLFIYITSLASNEMMMIPIKIFISTFTFIILLLTIYMITDSSMFISYNMNSDMTMIQNNLSYNEAVFPLIKLYNKPTEFITLLLVMYLFLTLIVIVKITNIFQGPLRQKN